MQKTTNKNGREQVFLLFFLAVLLLALAGILLWRTSHSAHHLVNTWRSELDLTEHAAARADLWLREAEMGEQIEAEEVFSGIRVDLILSLRGDGSWVRTVDAASYESAETKANEAMADALRQLLRLRIEALGRGGGTTEYAEARIRGAVGMSTEEYLRTYGPQLLPTLEELQTRYAGEGSYRLSGRKIQFSGENGNTEFLVSDRFLVLSGSGGTEVYVRDQAA